MLSALNGRDSYCSSTLQVLAPLSPAKPFCVDVCLLTALTDGLHSVLFVDEKSLALRHFLPGTGGRYFFVRLSLHSVRTHECNRSRTKARRNVTFGGNILPCACNCMATDFWTERSKVKGQGHIRTA